ncbi:hypothetical protein Desaci_2008 [Desulfosporosinus acidiphilus SJ4]|uniref:Uncharacterized protein n=1 Tax=Desulfosporosinus acidiphilus (strain DSM 22704 / JCM 16185 / SJ4) TaxID=646529 RepID=I4D5A9_DESAJ|nr:hypothetical protein [Desulfosporosinus acidiphilus]AFM40983.1 hypothetical protein Desaci_2008 [Desulfosporosinus acidiphilus SJ4]
MRKLISILTALLILVFPAIASAQCGITTWDFDPQRTATSISSSSTDPWVLAQGSGKVVSYAGKPVVVHIPSIDESYAPNPVTGDVPKTGVFTFNQFSSTTAITDPIGYTMYQYTWDDGGWGHVWKYTIKSGDLAEGNVITLTAADLIAAFPCGYSGGTNFANAPSGVTISNDGNFVAVGAGNKLYWWPIGNPGATLYSFINGNSDFDMCEASPIITPNGYIAVGCDNGGFVSTDLSGNTHNFLTSDSVLGSGDSSEAITSSPSWNPISNTIWFGIDSYSAPRLVSFDPSNDTSTIVGKGTILTPVFSPTPVDKVSGDVFNTDYGGNAYRWSSSGNLIQKWITPNGVTHVCSNMAIARDENGNDHVAWKDMNRQLENAITPSGSFWVESGGTNAHDVMDPSFVTSSVGDYIGEAFVDPSSGEVYYSPQPNSAISTNPHSYVPINQNNYGVIGDYIDMVYDADIGPVMSPAKSTSYTWSNDANGSPGILIYLLSPVSLEMCVAGPSGVVYAPPNKTITGLPGDTENITMFAPGLDLSGDTSDGYGVIHITGFPDGSSADKQVNFDCNTTDLITGSGSAAAFDSTSITLPTSSANYTLTLTETLYVKDHSTGVMEQKDYPSPTITINVPVVGVASPGNLTISSYHNGDTNNSGIDAGGYPNLVTGNPLKFNYGDTMLADLVIPVPAPPAGWQYYSSVLSGFITYPVNTPKPTGTAQIGEPLTIASTKTATFSKSTRAGSQENGASVNDSIASFPVEWPTWRPPIGLPGYDWDSTLTATWTQTVTYVHHINTPVGGFSQYRTYTHSDSTPSQELQRTGTDIYYIPAAREPWMR